MEEFVKKVDTCERETSTDAININKDTRNASSNTHVEINNNARTDELGVEYQEKIKDIHLDKINNNATVDTSDGDSKNKEEEQIFGTKDATLEIQRKDELEKIIKQEHEKTLLDVQNHKETMQNLKNWLNEAEELLSNQKLPSFDYKVLNEQLQSQKVLQKLLEDKLPTVQKLRATFDQNLGLALDIDRNTISKFDELADQSQTRGEDLRKVEQFSKLYMEKSQNLHKWIKDAELRLQQFDNVPIGENELKNQIDLQKQLHTEIEDNRSQMDDLMELNEKLAEFLSSEESIGLANDWESISSRYDALGRTSTKLSQILSEIVDRVQIFLVEVDRSIEWLDSTEKELNEKFDSISVYNDVLVKDCEQLMGLINQICQHESDVTQIIEEGSELCKHTSGEDRDNLQGKLLEIKSRYTELNREADSKLDLYNKAFVLTSDFHSKYHLCSDWLQEIESALLQLDKNSIDDQHEIIRDMQDGATNFRDVLKEIEEHSTKLSEIATCKEGVQTLHQMTERVGDRFNNVCQQLDQNWERLQLARQQSREIFAEMDNLIDNLQQAESKMSSMGAASSDLASIEAQLKDQTELDEQVQKFDIKRREISSTAKNLLTGYAPEDQQIFREKIEFLNELCESVSKLNDDRLAVLQQALPLAQHFQTCSVKVDDWLCYLENELENAPSITRGLHQENLKKQFEHNKVLQDSLQENRILFEQLNDIGAGLSTLCNESDQAQIKDALEQACDRLDAARDNILSRDTALCEAADRSSLHFVDRLDRMLDALSLTARAVRRAEPIAARPNAIREQIQSNCALMDELERKSDAFVALKKAAREIILKADPQDPSVADIEDKLERLDTLWDEIQNGTESRNRRLQDTLQLAEEFWDQLQNCVSSLRQLSEKLAQSQLEAADAGLEPEALRLQQGQVASMNEKLDGREERQNVEDCLDAGRRLMENVGEQERHEIGQQMEELQQVRRAVAEALRKREQNLLEAIDKSMRFFETLDTLVEFLNNAEQRFDVMSPVSPNLVELGQQLKDVLALKKEFDRRTVDLEHLNRLVSSGELAPSDGTSAGSPTSDWAASIKSPLDELNKRWDALRRGLASRERSAENALLEMGQFEGAYNQLIDWIDASLELVDDLDASSGDLEDIEMELAKHKVLTNDVLGHQPSIDTLNDAGRRLVGSDSDSAPIVESSLAELNSKWLALKERLSEKGASLTSAAKHAQSFAGQTRYWLGWIEETDDKLSQNKAVGGLPDTAEEQLNKFLVSFKEINQFKPKIEDVIRNNEDAALKNQNTNSSIVANDALILKHRFGALITKANDKKIKLEIALSEARDYDLLYRRFIDWLTKAEQHLNSQEPISRVLNIVTVQIEAHRNFCPDGEMNLELSKDLALDLEKKGTKLKYYCQKQDVILIKNLLVSAQHRWEKVLSRYADRTKQFESIYHDVKDFNDALENLNDWLDAKDDWLKNEQEQVVPTNVEKIKELLQKHKECQKELGFQQPLYDTVQKLGKHLRDHAPKHEQPVVQELLNKSRDKWMHLSQTAVERQRKLEEALLFSGHFAEAVDALLEWISVVEPTLSGEQPTRGDADTVSALLDDYATFAREFNARAANVETIRRAADQLLKAGDDENRHEILERLRTVDERWEKLARNAQTTAENLEEAKNLANKFQLMAYAFLDRMSELELKVKLTGSLPDDEEMLQKQSDHLMELQAEIEVEKSNLDSALNLADEILLKAHQTALEPMKHWKTILNSRFDEVSTFGRERQQRLADQIDAVQKRHLLLEELLKFLDNMQNGLDEAERVELPILPEDAHKVEKLLDDHIKFEQRLSVKQPDIDEVTKGKKKMDKSEMETSGKLKITTPPTARRTSALMKNPKVQKVSEKWSSVWLSAMRRKTKLIDLLDRLRELHRLRDFDFDDWRKRYMNWMNHKKSRVMDFFRRQDTDNDGKVTRREFIDGIIASKFPTTQLEMEKVADIFDKNRDGYIDYREFVAALKTSDKEKYNENPRVQIEQEVQRQMQLCTCNQKYRIQEVAEGKYKFGEQLRLVRILRSTVMVRVGGGWVALDEFLVKNDPCRAKGRTNIELRERFILPEGASQTMTWFKSKTPRTTVSGSQHGSSGSSAGSSSATGHSHFPGPIMKIREKTDRSLPMSKTFRSPWNGAPCGWHSDYPPSSKRPQRLVPDRSPSTELLSPPDSTIVGSKVTVPNGTGLSGSRSSSRLGSEIPVPSASSAIRTPSRPSSRTGSDISDISLHSRDSLGGATPSKIPSASKKRSFGSKKR